MNFSFPRILKNRIRLLTNPSLFQDLEVPYQQSLTLCQALASNDVDMIFRKNGPHQLDQPVDVEIFLNTLDRMLKDHPIRA